jgi:bacillopeptidase F
MAGVLISLEAAALTTYPESAYLVVFSQQFPARETMLQFELDQTPLDQRARKVIKETMALSMNSCTWFGRWLQAYNLRNETNWMILDTFWIANAVVIDADPLLLEEVRALSGIASVESAHLMAVGYTESLASPSGTVTQSPSESLCLVDSQSPEIPGGKEPGLITIQAPLMWARGYTGKGRRAMLMDTGVWPNHPALRGKFLGQRLGLSQSWYPYDEPKPADKNGTHGTHVVGTILGLDTATRDTIGAAFGAYFIATDPIVTNLALVRSWTALMNAYQWALNPDGDTSTTVDIPDVINNSWGRDNLGFDSVCQATVVALALQAVEAAGTANVFSAGNDGPGNYTIGVPAQVIYDSLNVFCVGALNANNSLAGFSSNGPSRCGNDSALTIKPEVSAPGVNIRSADGMNGYGQKSGTSMASPHVSGAVLLLKEAFPQLSGRQILNALYQTASDLGTAGEDNLFGRGLIQVDSAYRYLASRFTVQAPRNSGPDLAILGLDSPMANQIGLSCQAAGSTIVPMRIRVSNLGDTAVQGISLDLFEGLVWQQTLNFSTINLNPGQSTVLSLNSLPRNPSNRETKWMFKIRGGTITESDTLNNYWYLEFRNIQSAGDLITEHFNDTIRLPFVTEPYRVADWTVENPDEDDYTGTTQDATWYFASVPSTRSCPNPSGSGAFQAGTGKAAVMRMRDYSSRLRQEDHLISPPFYLQNAGLGPYYRLFFDVAYYNRNSSFRDSLLVGFSTDCGKTYTTIYRNGGDSMRTHSAINPADSQAFQRIVVDHPVLQQNTSGSYRLRFTTKNDFGGNLYLTNVGLFRFFHAGWNDHARATPLAYRIFPNPAKTNEFYVQVPEGMMAPRVRIYNQTGQLMSMTDGHPVSGQNGLIFQYEAGPLQNGVYQLTLSCDNQPQGSTPLNSQVEYHRWIKINP